MVTLTRRLQAIADMVPQGSTVVDVGTDHGYIPVYLVQNSICDSAVACDINEGPLNSCRLLVSQSNLNDRIECVLSDGLKNISSFYDTVVIAGMGGELIANILSNAVDISSKRIILNPMTHPELARKWLYDNGFEITKDIIVADGKHHYNVFCAQHTDIAVGKSVVDYYLGAIDDFGDKEYFEHLLVYLRNKQKSGADLKNIICKIEEKL